MTKTAVIAVSDTHINSTVALSPRSVNLDDGGTWRSSRQQAALWECWQDYWQQAASIKADQKIAVLNGDIGELDT